MWWPQGTPTTFSFLLVSEVPNSGCTEHLFLHALNWATVPERDVMVPGERKGERQREVHRWRKQGNRQRSTWGLQFSQIFTEWKGRHLHRSYTLTLSCLISQKRGSIIALLGLLNDYTSQSVELLIFYQDRTEEKEPRTISTFMLWRFYAGTAFGKSP